MKIAIIDCIGLHYDGDTLKKRGIGGSESSIISISKELVKLGFEVTVFNDCDTEEAKPGTYDGVVYQPIGSDVEDKFDIVISQRTVIPFTPIEQYDLVKQPAPRDYDPNWFVQFQGDDIFKILWMQDTFIWGDMLLEDLVVNGHIDEIFNLSDWHISYTTNCNHGKKRIFEVLKNKIFATRNGINRWIDEVDISAKDPNHFVYNASITKGMIPLVKNIWPELKKRIPQARLTIIGGYYDFKDNDKSPYKDQWLDLYQSAKNDPSITFTGIVPQPKIAEIVANASFMIYPGAYPETSGIATIESVNYNTPILGTRFGAMNESGTEDAGYYIDYAIEPNSLFPGISLNDQVNKFVDMCVAAHSNKYLHQQKMYACNNVKDISTWDTIALQWKQHFYFLYGKKLNEEEQERVDWINYRVHKVFQRRYSNLEAVQTYANPEQVESIVQDAVTVAIVDIMGACYDGATLSRRGLGGSEAAVVQVAEKMSKIGFRVTVFNACDEDDCFPGFYNGVEYLPLSMIKDADNYDVVISSRVATPFVPESWNIEQTTTRKVPYEDFRNLREAKMKILWMHDTFSASDTIIEKLLVDQHVNELWTLSDFHYNYLTNNNHGSTYGQMRNYEVLRNHTWITRNGMKLPERNRNLNNKEQYHFVFNSNRSKGLHPLLHDVWPQLKKKLPQAKLTVIGGYYKLGKAVKHDDEYEDFMRMVGDAANDDSITFTGILSLEEIYDIYVEASYLLYPTEHPETFGISTLEAQYHDMQVITCKFGALEETAYPSDSLIEYSSTPNALKGDINRFEQAEKLANIALERVVQGDRKFHKHKFKSIREIAGWDTVALEWKQHIYTKLGLYLSASESQRALYTKSQWQKIFGRRVTTSEQWVAPFSEKQKKIVVISPFYNAGYYIRNCINSVAAQIYDNYEHIIIDDCSTEESNEALNAIAELPESIHHKFRVIKNPSNKGAVYNHINTIRDLNDDDIVILLDGDDWLTNRPDIFQYYNRIHTDNDFTYGSCWSLVDNIPLVSQPYPEAVKTNKSYKQHLFNWYAPYTHLRTFKAKLIKNEPDSVFQNQDGEWFRAGGDLATFYKALENCDSDRVYCVSDIMYQYNDKSPYNDYKIHGDEQTKTALSIVGKAKPMTKKKILIAIPCKNDIEADTFKSIYDLEVTEGYETEFQYFYGYAVDQVRNLIAHWVVNAYDYLLAIDHDVVFPADTLKKMLAHDKPVVSGIYRQRLEPQMLEVYNHDMRRLDASQLTGSLQEIGGCGFGCVLVKKEVFANMSYPWFFYHQALNHNNTFSEDLDFCKKAREKGFKIYADSSILCKHIGQRVFEVELSKIQEDPVKARLRELHDMDLLPPTHLSYLKKISHEGVQPKVIYDIGACVLHWTNSAKKVWPDAKYVALEAMNETEFLYQENAMPYCAGALLYKEDDVDIEFYQNLTHPGGNSIYRENPELSPASDVLFTENHKVVKKGMRLDTLAKMFNFPAPDMIKIDVQGAEMDVLMGATECLKTCKDLILELQVEEYNIGSPKLNEVKDYLESIGFIPVLSGPFSHTEYDGDYHFTRA